MGQGSEASARAVPGEPRIPLIPMQFRLWNPITCRVLAAVVVTAGLAILSKDVGAEMTMPRPSGVTAGDPARGRALVADRQQGLCLLCHSAPVGDARQQGNLAPPLDGVGGRLDEDQLRLRIHDSRRINPESLMPAYGVADTAPRVAAAWRGKPIFNPQQVEDVVAWLATLK